MKCSICNQEPALNKFGCKEELAIMMSRVCFRCADSLTDGVIRARGWDKFKDMVDEEKNRLDTESRDRLCNRKN